MTGDYDAELCFSKRVNAGVTDAVFQLPERARAISPRPGQFAHVSAPAVFLRRPISIAGFDTERNRVRLIIRETGAGTKNICGMKPGGTTKILLPLGKPFPAEHIRPDSVVWLVGGGVGAAPLLFAAKSMYGRAAELKSFLGFSDEHSVFGAEEMDNLTDMTLDIGGLITDKVSSALGTKQPCMIFSCGPKPMLGALKKICGERKIPLFVSLEERMGCGVGACLVCNCRTKEADGYARYKRVCKDGPIFDAEEVSLE